MKPVLLFFMICGFLLNLNACGGRQVPPDPLWDAPAHRAARLGNEAYHKGCYIRAQNHYQAALEGYATADNAEGTILALNNIGNTYRMLQNREDAFACYEEALYRAQRINHPDLTQLTSANLISLLLDENRGTEARSALNRLDNRADIPGISRSEARLLDLEGKTFEAISFLENTISQTEDEERAGLYFTLGNILMHHEKTEKAQKAFTQALKLDKSAGRFSATASDLMALAHCDNLLGNHETAYDFARRAMEIWALIGADHEINNQKPFFMELAEKSGADTRVPLYFIDTWIRGRAVAGPCD
ncbi:tetratricopeptide repeat protein [Desulfobotulus sp. H1]|uniref:Tetratricopeptide repeat protein n=1 Tax=Desulfobotulus pelophilus TaxID=2823377 RepID=A0ABT3N720_9BACT|nr:tetratricopeptide repeat protein [Desulfobotulus pelophilus]MCW7753239.1 tetratricopeptide repeat protein [Desulfobotulus pelophilus]